MYKNIPIGSARQNLFESHFSEPDLNVRQLFIKRLLDITLSLIGILCILSWLTPLLVILIKLESDGPVFFIQERMGFRKIPFRCVKFRTMRLNDEADVKEASGNDSRITKLGSFLRKTCLDEMPQFFNVLVGEMTIVGPRPYMITEAKKYEALTDRFEERQSVRPGITGWAQISGLRGRILDDDEMRMRIEADIWYLRNWSFFLDIKIIFLTALTVLNLYRNRSPWPF